MSVETLIGLGFYLFPDEADYVDWHARFLVRKLSSKRCPKLEPSIAAFTRYAAPASLAEGRRWLWRNAADGRAVCLYRYGDTVLLVGICPAGEPDAETWRAWFARPGKSTAPYQVAYIHLVEHAADPASLAASPGQHRYGVRVEAPADTDAPATREYVQCTLRSERELLVETRLHSRWFHEWMFDRAALFRLLLFHGKAQRYHLQLKAVDVLSARAQSQGHFDVFSKAQLSSIERYRKNLDVAIKNFGRAWQQAGASDDAAEQPLLRYFTDTHHAWALSGNETWSAANQAVIAKEKELRERLEGEFSGTELKLLVADAFPEIGSLDHIVAEVHPLPYRVNELVRYCRRRGWLERLGAAIVAARGSGRRRKHFVCSPSA